MKTVKVMYRQYRDGTEIAVFPYEIWNNHGHVTTYEKVGQHGGADYLHILSKTTPCKKPLLKNELFRVGYENLQEVKQQHFDTYMTAWKITLEPHILEHVGTIRKAVKGITGKNCATARKFRLHKLGYQFGPTLFLFWLKPVGTTKVQPNGDIWVKIGYASETSIIQVIKKPSK